MKVTWFDANSWLIEAQSWRVLIDPWLVGDLVFGDMPWLVKGVRPVEVEIPKNIDLILLSQGLADHAHPETLRMLDKSIPVVASPDAAKVANAAGYQSVTVLNHGEITEQTKEPQSQQREKSGSALLRIEALQGAVVGAMKRENGYILTFGSQSSQPESFQPESLQSNSPRVYYEPHGYPDIERMREIGSVDVVITPLADISLAKVAPVVRGGDIAMKIAKLMKPQVMMPTAEEGRVSYEGLISGALQTTGGADAMRSRLKEAGLDIQVVQPASGETTTLELRSSVTAS